MQICKTAIALERELIGQRPLSYYTAKHIESGTHPSWRWSEVRSHCRTKNAYRPYQCQVCGYDRHIEYAHIQALSACSPNDTLDVINDPTNVLLLCPNHHTEFDSSKHPEWRIAILSKIFST